MGSNRYSPVHLLNPPPTKNKTANIKNKTHFLTERPKSSSARRNKNQRQNSVEPHRPDITSGRFYFFELSSIVGLSSILSWQVMLFALACQIGCNGFGALTF